MIDREEIQKHWTDADWLLEHGMVSRRPAEDWQPIEEAVPDVGLCWLTVELEYGDRYVKKDKLSDADIQRGIRREHPCPIAFMPCEIEPEPYKAEKAEEEKCPQISGGKLFDLLANRLFKAETTENRSPRYFSLDGDEILCRTAGEASAMADFLEAICGVTIHTAYYDPKEDRENDEPDCRTGFWSVTCDS